MRMWIPALLLPSILLLTCATGSRQRQLPMMDINIDVRDAGCFTPTNFRERFLASCKALRESRCSSAWNNFMDAFAFEDPYNVEPSNYDAYFDTLPVKTSRNTVLFWSGVFDLAREISRQSSKVASSFTEPSSAIINELDPPVDCWCGSETGIDYSNPCSGKPYFSFFVAFSCKLAQSAEGVVFWVGDGERQNGAYRSDSYFAEYEFPKLRSSRVTKLVIIDVHKEGRGEFCGEGTLATLRNLVLEKFGEDGYACYDVNGTDTANLAEEALKVISKEEG